MKTAHVKTVDGTTIMIPAEHSDRLADYMEQTFSMFSTFWWTENNETVCLVRDKIISVRFREVE